MKRGKFISLEGTEGAGKSTARLFILDYLEKAGISAIATREPGGTDIAEKIRHVLLSKEESEIVLPECELLLMFAGRAQHIHHCILPALNSGKWVLTDRFVDASYAYQGGGRLLPKTFIAALDKQIVAGLYPDLTLLLDVPTEIGMQRALHRGEGKDRIEAEKTDFFNRVRTTYLERAAEDPVRIKVIDATPDINEVQAAIQRELDLFLARG